MIECLRVSSFEGLETITFMHDYKVCPENNWGFFYDDICRDGGALIGWTCDGSSLRAEPVAYKELCQW